MGDNEAGAIPCDSPEHGGEPHGGGGGRCGWWVLGGIGGFLGGSVLGPAGQVAGGVAGSAAGTAAGDTIGRAWGTETVSKEVTRYRDVVVQHHQTVVDGSHQTQVAVQQSLAIAPVAGAAVALLSCARAALRGEMSKLEVLGATAAGGGRGLAVALPTTGALCAINHGASHGASAGIRHACAMGLANSNPLVAFVAGLVGIALGAGSLIRANTDADKSSAPQFPQREIEVLSVRTFPLVMRRLVALPRAPVHKLQ